MDSDNSLSFVHSDPVFVENEGLIQNASQEEEQQNLSQMEQQQQQQPEQLQEEKQSQKGSVHWWNIEYWQFLFNVNTKQVLRRIFGAILPIPPKFFQITEQNPDLYGPFWIASTLVFIMSAAGNVGAWIDQNLNDTNSDWQYDVNKLSVAAGVIYGYLAIIPLLLYFFCRYNSIPLQLMQMFCIFGYSMFIYVPISIFCVVPISYVRWGLVAFGFLVSTATLISNYFLAMNEHRGKGIIVMVIIFILQLAFALTCALYFFTY